MLKVNSDSKKIETQIIHGCPLIALPEELLLKIFSILNAPRDVASLGATCAKLYVISKDNHIWKPLFQAHFPRALATDDYFNAFRDQTTVRHQNIQRGECMMQTLCGDKIQNTCIKFSDDFIMMGSGTYEIRIWDKRTGNPISTFMGNGTSCYFLGTAGGRLYSLGEDEKILILDVESGTLLKTLDLKSLMLDLKGFTWNAEKTTWVQIVGSFLFTGDMDGTVQVWDIEKEKHLQTIDTMAFNPNYVLAFENDLLFAGSKYGAIKVLDLKTGKCLHSLCGHIGPIERLDFLGGHLISSASNGKLIKVWDPKTGKCLRRVITNNNGRGKRFEFGEDRLIMGSVDGTIKIWEMNSDKDPQVLKGHKKGAIECLHVAEGLLFSSSVADRVINVWDIKTGECLQTLLGHTSIITSFEFKDGRLISGSFDGMVKFWDFDVSYPSSYPLDVLLQMNLQILEEMAALEQSGNYDGLVTYTEKEESSLRPEIQERLEACCLKFFTPLSREQLLQGNELHPSHKEMIIKKALEEDVLKKALFQVRAEMCVEMLLAALYYELDDKVKEMLIQINSISPKLSDELYGLLCSECGMPDDLEWGMHAFLGTGGYSASNLSKIQAVQKFQQILKSKLD